MASVFDKLVNAFSPGPGPMRALTRQAVSGVDFAVDPAVKQFCSFSESDIMALKKSTAQFYIDKLNLAGAQLPPARTAADMRRVLHEAFLELTSLHSDKVSPAHSSPSTPRVPAALVSVQHVASPPASNKSVPALLPAVPAVQPAPSDSGLVASMKSMLSDAMAELRGQLIADFDMGFGKLRDAIAVFDSKFAALEAKCTAQQNTIDQQQQQINKLEASLFQQGLQVQECMQAVKAAQVSPAQQAVPSDLLWQIQWSQTQLRQQHETSLREQRKTHLVLTGLSESADLAQAVPELLATVGCASVKPSSMQRIGKRTTAHARAAAASSGSPPSTNPAAASAVAKPRPVLVILSSVQERNTVLKGRAKLAGTKFGRVGINPSLTRQQQDRKNAAWSMYRDARAAGKRALG